MRLASSLCRGTALVALCLGSHGIAQAQGLDFDGNWYIQGGGGLNFADDIQLTSPQSPGQFIDFGYDLGFLAGGAVGYRWDNGFRTELEGVYRHNEFDELCSPQLGLGGATCIDADNPQLAQTGIANEVSSIGIMFNILYDIDTGTAITPYLGGGVGAGYVDWELALGGQNVSIDGWGVALQGIAGVSYALSDSFELFTDYRYYTVLGDHETQIPPGGVGGGAGGTLEIDDYAAHSVFFGARYHFLPPPPPPPAPAPVAEEPPPPPPAQDRFIVFFDWDRSNLTPQANGVLDQAVATYNQAGFAQVLAEAHTDTSGPAGYNVGLSQRRGESVRQGLIARGIAPDEIVVRAFGETQLLVPTPDGVREPQNRRVEIILM